MRDLLTHIVDNIRKQDWVPFLHTFNFFQVLLYNSQFLTYVICFHTVCR